ncbi:unnamed protein product, partial [Polarella glacialis]
DTVWNLKEKLQESFGKHAFMIKLIDGSNNKKKKKNNNNTTTTTTTTTTIITTTTTIPWFSK